MKNKKNIVKLLIVVMLVNLWPLNTMAGRKEAGLTYSDVNKNLDGNGWILSTYPENNKGSGTTVKVERNPLIEFRFKYPVELVDSNKIEISSDGGVYAVDLEEDVWISDDNILKIDINSIYRGGKNPLRANTAYKIKLGKGTVRLKRKEETSTIEDIFNQDIFLYFITGTEFSKKDKGLRIKAYTTENKKDDITSPTETELGKTENIHIKFNKNIKWNKTKLDTVDFSNEEALNYFKLYRIPSAYKKEYDQEGISYDKEFRYDSMGRYLPLNKRDEVELDSVEIINSNTIKLVPKYDLIPYNRYEIELTKKDIIISEDKETLRILDPILRGKAIWTDKEGDINPKWDMDKISAEEVIEIEKAPIEGENGSIILHGAPKYNSKIDKPDAKPIVLYVDSEVTFNPEKANPIEGINLIEGYREDEVNEAEEEEEEELDNTGIKWYQIEYIENEGKIKTKISIYPDEELKSGRYYELRIKENVFYSRSGINLTGLDIKFIVEGDNKSNREIDKFQITNSSSLKEGRNIFIREKFNEKEGNLEFRIVGYNFAEDIKQMRFVRTSDKKTIILPKKSLKFEDVTLITGKIDDAVKAEFFRNDSGNRNTGTYDIYLDFEKGSSAKSTIGNKERNQFTVLDRPMIKNVNPKEGEKFVQPSRLVRRFIDSSGKEEVGVYIEIEFEKLEGELQLVGRKDEKDGVKVNVLGDVAELVDQDSNIQIEDNRVYIPIKEGGLEENQEYEVNIIENDFIEYKELAEADIKLKNLEYSWRFKTNYKPNAVVSGLYDGSLAENYDYNYPIVIDGNNFSSKTRVRFRNTESEEYYDADSITREEDRIYIFLPRRRDRLPVGQYDIEISNGPNYELFLKYGVLSIVKEGKYIPNERYTVKEDDYYGEVKADTKTSSDTLELDRRERDRGYLRLNLDELMGEDTWSRSLEYPVSRSENISLLNLESIWADIELSNVRLSILNNENIIKLRVGRVSPVKSDNFKMQLMDRNIKSEFIEVDGENFDFDLVKIKIPYEKSDSGNLEMLKYDEFLRKFIPVPSIVNKVDKTVESTTMGKGIFVIVE